MIRHTDQATGETLHIWHDAGAIFEIAVTSLDGVRVLLREWDGAEHIDMPGVLELAERGGLLWLGPFGTCTAGSLFSDWLPPPSRKVLGSIVLWKKAAVLALIRRRTEEQRNLLGRAVHDAMAGKPLQVIVPPISSAWGPPQSNPLADLEAVSQNMSILESMGIPAMLYGYPVVVGSVPVPEPTTEEPVTLDELRRLLGAPGEGVPLVRINGEGGWRPSEN